MDILVFSDTIEDLKTTQLLFGDAEGIKSLILTSKEAEKLHKIIYVAIIRTQMNGEPENGNESNGRAELDQ